MPTSRGKRARSIGVGIVGFGFMGRTHLAAYRAAARAGFPNRVVALCDSQLAARGGKGFPLGNLEKGPNPLAQASGLAVHSEIEALLADDSIELVSVCTPTHTHVPLALAALAAKKHVLLEKPIALRARDVERLAAASQRARRLCMPAMCMRFWPGWSWLKERIEANTFGPVRSAVFRRLGSRPGWSQGFYDDPKKSGGALFDLHVHDADFVRFCFGAPDSVVSTGTLDHVTTLYRYAKGPAHVVAEGGWDHDDGFPFFMGYNVIFERATAEFAHGRSPVLTLSRDGRTKKVPVGTGTGYDGEIRHALETLARRHKPRATIVEAVELVRMLEAERKSLASGRAIRL